MLLFENRFIRNAYSITFPSKTSCQHTERTQRTGIGFSRTTTRTHNQKYIFKKSKYFKNLLAVPSSNVSSSSSPYIINLATHIGRVMIYENSCRILLHFNMVRHIKIYVYIMKEVLEREGDSTSSSLPSCARCFFSKKQIKMKFIYWRSLHNIPKKAPRTQFGFDCNFF